MNDYQRTTELRNKDGTQEEQTIMTTPLGLNIFLNTTNNIIKILHKNKRFIA